jgi:hypothetical protein
MLEASEACEIQFDLLISVLAGPDVERSGGDLVDERRRQS